MAHLHLARARVRKNPSHPDESEKTIIRGMAPRHTSRYLLWRQCLARPSKQFQAIPLIAQAEYAPRGQGCQGSTNGRVRRASADRRRARRASRRALVACARRARRASRRRQDDPGAACSARRALGRGEAAVAARAAPSRRSRRGGAHGLGPRRESRRDDRPARAPAEPRLEPHAHRGRHRGRVHPHDSRRPLAPERRRGAVRRVP